MKIFAASIQTETNTFSPIPTSKEMFEETYKTFRGQDPINPNFWGAPMVRFEKLAKLYGDSYVEGLCVAAEPAGIVPNIVYVNYRDQILNDLRAQMPLDIVLLNLHGAMVAENNEDCEGDIIEKVRNIVGPHVVIGVEVDLHTHLTNKMTTNADLIIGFKLYPHTDVEDRAEELYKLTRNIALKKLSVKHATYDCMMINLFPTSRSPIKEFIHEIFSLEKNDPKIVSISFLHGFIWGDVADLGAKILVYTNEELDSKGEHANSIATYLGKKLYDFRSETKLDLISIDELKQILTSNINFPLVVADFSDNPGLGGMGDATFILKEILDLKITNNVFATIYDPEVVEQAFEVGVDKTLTVTLGGKFGSFSGEKIVTKAKVLFLNTNLMQTFTNLSLSLGKSAALEIEGNIVIVNSLRSQIYSPDVITNMGVLLANKKAIIVKSSEHFRTAFSLVAEKIVRVSSPGVGNMNIAEIPYKNISRKIWPINSTT